MICIKGKHRQNLCKVVEMASYTMLRMGVNAAKCYLQIAGMLVLTPLNAVLK
jgi:hypothetical protein